MVLGVGLAREDELDRPVAGMDHLDQPLDVLEDQAGALVGGEPAGEADRQGVQVERLGTPDGPRPRPRRGGWACAARRRRTKSISRAFRTCCVSQSSASSTVSMPVPGLGMAHPLGPVGAEVAVVEQVHLRGDPAPARGRRW